MRVDCNAYSLARLWAAAYQSHKSTMETAASRREGRSDSCFLQKFDALRGKNKCDEKFLAGFLAEYRVSRSFGRANAPSGCDVLEHVKSVTAGWSKNDSLAKKATALLSSLPGRRQEAGARPGSERVLARGPESAASKMAWFFCQDGWTMFDSRASSALGSSGFVNFYKTLDGLEFGKFCEVTRGILEKYNQSLKPERIVDKALYILGGIHNFKNISSIDAGKGDMCAIRFGEEVAEATADGALPMYLRNEFGLV